MVVGVSLPRLLLPNLQLNSMVSASSRKVSGVPSTISLFMLPLDLLLHGKTLTLSFVKQQQNRNPDLWPQSQRHAHIVCQSQDPETKDPPWPPGSSHSRCPYASSGNLERSLSQDDQSSHKLHVCQDLRGVVLEVW